KKFPAAPAQKKFLAVPFQRHVREIAAHRFRRRELRHRAMKTLVPRGMLIRMTRAAGFGTDVTAGAIFHRKFLEKLVARGDFIIRARFPGEATEERSHHKKK